MLFQDAPVSKPLPMLVLALAEPQERVSAIPRDAIISDRSDVTGA